MYFHYWRGFSRYPPFSKEKIFFAWTSFSSSCYQKELNRYQYLPHSSCHPQHQKKAFIIGELRRYIQQESTVEGCKRIRRLLFARLRTRGYTDKFLTLCFNQITYSMRSSLLHAPSKRNAMDKGNPLVLKLYFSKYTKSLKLGKTLIPSIHELLKDDPELCHLPKPMICWRNPRNLRSKNKVSPKSLKNTPWSYHILGRAKFLLFL